MMHSKATIYRQTAKDCIKLAERVTSPWDRARLLAMAEQWHELADRLEAHTVKSSE
jgi:hypothetical protein